MNTNVIKLVACLAWGGVAVSSASPANALLATSTSASGGYATCGGSAISETFEYCGITFNYIQSVRLQDRACNGGGCASPNIHNWVEGVYSSGRKTATLQQTCDTASIYGLGTCAC
jgi:hypothetical protein